MRQCYSALAGKRPVWKTLCGTVESLCGRGNLFWRLDDTRRGDIKASARQREDLQPNAPAVAFLKWSASGSGARRCRKTSCKLEETMTLGHRLGECGNNTVVSRGVIRWMKAADGSWSLIIISAWPSFDLNNLGLALNREKGSLILDFDWWTLCHLHSFHFSRLSTRFLHVSCASKFYREPRGEDWKKSKQGSSASLCLRRLLMLI